MLGLGVLEIVVFLLLFAVLAGVVLLILRLSGRAGGRVARLEKENRRLRRGLDLRDGE